MSQITNEQVERACEAMFNHIRNMAIAEHGAPINDESPTTWEAVTASAQADDVENVAVMRQMARVALEAGLA